MADVQLRGNGKNIVFNGKAVAENADVLVWNSGEYSGKKLIWFISGTAVGTTIQVSADKVNWVASGVTLPANATTAPAVLDGPYPFIRIIGADCVARITT